MKNAPRIRAYGGSSVMPVMVPVDVAAMIHEARTLEHEHTLLDVTHAADRIAIDKLSSNRYSKEDRTATEFRAELRLALASLDEGGA